MVKVALEILAPLWGFVASVSSLILLVVFGVEVAIAIVLSTLIFGLLSVKLQEIAYYTVEGLIGIPTLDLLATLALALFLTFQLKESGVLEKTTTLFRALGCRFTALAVPAVVGLIPMPGGALVSAMMLRDLYMKELKLNRDYATFLNYWFRHIWVPSWPLYQAIILSSAILEVSVSKIVSITFIASIGSILSGLIISSKGLRRIDTSVCTKSKITLKLLVEGTWPYIMVALLVFGVKLNIKLALLTVLLTLLVVKKPTVKSLIGGLKFALSPRIVSIIFSVMVFKRYVEVSGAAEQLYNALVSHGIPPLIVAFLIPFSIGVATSGEFIYAAIAFPILSTITGVGPYVKGLPLLTAFTAGYLAVMLSPVHLCVILTADHYNTHVGRVYKYTLPAVILGYIITFGLAALIYGYPS